MHFYGFLIVVFSMEIPDSFLFFPVVFCVIGPILDAFSAR